MSAKKYTKLFKSAFIGETSLAKVKLVVADSEYPRLLNQIPELTADVTSQQMMLTPFKHLIQPLVCPEVHIYLTHSFCTPYRICEINYCSI